jgi:hypothetical protein
VNRALRTACEALGIPASSVARVVCEGSAMLPSAFRVTDLAAGSIGAAALTLSELIGTQGDDRPDVRVDRRLASLWFGMSIRPIGWAMPAPWDAVAGDYRTEDGWIRLHTNAPHHRSAALHVLDCVGEREAVAAAVARWQADDLEAAIVAADGCAATMRSIAAWDVHPQGRAVAAEPLIDVAYSPVAASVGWRPAAIRPLAGLKVLDLTRVLAGPIATRFLAGFGADVLRIDPPSWDEPGVIPEVTLGKRCARLDLERSDDRATFERLLSEADALVHGYRPGALDGLGYGTANRRAINPDLIEVSLDAYGWSGPWKERRGFDSLVQMSSGIADAGMRWKQADRPTPLPVQALDHATGYFIAAAAVAAIRTRIVDAKVSTMRLSLARTARLLVDSGREDGTGAMAAPEDPDYAAATETTDWGRAQRLCPPATVDGVPMTWDRGATRLGSSRASWGCR